MSTPRKQRNNAIMLTEEYAEQLCNFLIATKLITKTTRCPLKTQGLPTKKILCWRYKYNARVKYRLVWAETGLPVIPTGDDPNIYLFRQCMKILHEMGLDPTHPGIHKALAREVQARFHVVDAENRVATVTSDPALYTALGQFKTQEQVDHLENKVDHLENQVHHLTQELAGQNRTFTVRFDVLEQTVQELAQRQHTIQAAINRFSSYDPQQSKHVTDILQQHSQQIEMIREAPSLGMPDPIYFYSKCSTINRLLRSLFFNDQVAIQEKNAIERSLSQKERFQGGHLYRGVDLADAPEWFESSIDQGVFTDCHHSRIPCGFTSTSTDDKIAWEFAYVGKDSRPCVFQITEHFSGVNVEPWVAAEFKDEKEVLFCPGVRFEIYGVNKQARYKGIECIHVWMREKR